MKVKVILRVIMKVKVILREKKGQERNVGDNGQGKRVFTVITRFFR